MREYKYRAFISYSHADEQWGDWLHRALETFRVPDGLVGVETAVGPAPKRLTPIFRDRDDLPAAGNLNAEIQAALADSRFLIVLCSPNSTRSKWVNEEIKLFKKLHGPDRTLAVIIAGDPGASAVPGREADECFPHALRFLIDESGNETDEPAEPIAADARKGRDGRRNAILKLAAGLIGVGLDDLVQRDANRRAQSARLFAGGAAIIAASMAILAVSAFNARDEAHHMRGEAENLIEFMLTDLRGKLEPVGRLDALDVVGEKALDYYANQDARKLDADALGRRARALLLVGEIDQRRNDLDAALEAYEAAAATTSELLRREPGNPQRIFDHAQSVFYVGDVARLRGEIATAEVQYREYLRLAERLVKIDAASAKWRLELAYATSNLGALKYAAGEFEAAIVYFEQSAAARRALYEAAPADNQLAAAYAYALSWQAYAELTRGAYKNAIALINEQLAIYDRSQLDPENFRFLDTLVTAQRRLAEAQLALGHLKSARESIDSAEQTVSRLIARESNNANWNINASYVSLMNSILFGIANEQPAEIAAADRAIEFSRNVYDRDPSDVNGQIALGLALAQRVRVGHGALEVSNAAATLKVLLADAVNSGGENIATLIGEASLTLAQHEKGRDRKAQANQYVSIGIRALASRQNEIGANPRISLLGLYIEAGEFDRARSVSAALDELGITHPDFVAAKKRLQIATAD